MGALGAVSGRSSRPRAAFVGVVCAVAGLLLSAPGAVAQQHAATPVVAQGAGMGATPSAAVRSIQRTLVRHGYHLGRPGVDGRFGPLTARAVRRVQARAGIAVDGAVGPATRKAIRALRQPTSRPQRQASPKPRPTAQPTPTPAPQPRPATPAPHESNPGWVLPAVGASAAIGAFLAGMWLLGLNSARRRRRPTPPPATPIALRAADAASWLAPGDPVIGYVTVSPDANRSDAAAPAAVVEEACAQSGWELAEVVSDRETGRGLQRPGLTYALEQIADGKAHGLIVGEVRRLTRSIGDLGALVEWFRDAGAALVAVDLDLDTSTAEGRAAAARIITLGGWDQDWIARRTREGLATRSSGRPAVSDQPELVERITAMRAADMTMQGIADRLNAEGVPTLRGGAVWRPSSVQAALGYRRPRSRGARDQLPTLDQRRRA